MTISYENSEFLRTMEEVSSLIDLGKRIPDQVFSSKFQFCCFMTLDEIFFSEQFVDLQAWVATKKSEHLIYVGLGKNESTSDILAAYSILKFSKEHKEEDFLFLMNGLEDDISIEMHASELYVVYSGSFDWLIYGDRNCGLLVAGFSSKEDRVAFVNNYSLGVLENVDTAMEHALENGKDSAFLVQFKSNYAKYVR